MAYDDSPKTRFVPKEPIVGMQAWLIGQGIEAALAADTEFQHAAEEWRTGKLSEPQQQANSTTDKPPFSFKECFSAFTVKKSGLLGRTTNYIEPPLPERRLNLIGKVVERDYLFPRLKHRLIHINFSGSRAGDDRGHAWQNCTIRNSVMVCSALPKTIHHCRFVDTNLRKANLMHADILGGSFSSTDIAGANLSYATFENVDLSGLENWQSATYHKAGQRNSNCRFINCIFPPGMSELISTSPYKARIFANRAEFEQHLKAKVDFTNLDTEQLTVALDEHHEEETADRRGPTVTKREDGIPNITPATKRRKENASSVPNGGPDGNRITDPHPEGSMRDDNIVSLPRPTPPPRP